MVRSRFSSAICVLLLSVASASCASARDAAFSPSTWTGFHFGLGVGYGMVNQEVELETAALPDNPLSPAASFDFSGIGGEGRLATLEAGFDVQLNRYLVLGGNVDYTLSDINTHMDGTLGPLSADYDLQARSAISAIVRLGVLANNSALIYGLFGRTRTRFEGDVEVPDITQSSYHYDADGWTVGAGLEGIIADDVSLKLEYRYTQNEKLQIFDSFNRAEMYGNSNVQTTRLVLSYRPGVVARQLDDSESYWNGYHVGVGGGYQFLNHVTENEIFDVTAFDIDGLAGEGFLGTVEFGRDKLVNDRFVVGASVGYTYSNALSALDVQGVGVGATIDVEATHTVDALVRGGVLTGPDLLWYGLAGWSLTKFNGVIDDQTNDIDNFDFLLHGLTVGGGVEVMLNEKFSLKSEYRYINYLSVDTELLEIAGVKDRANAHSMRAVLTFRF